MISQILSLIADDQLFDEIIQVPIQDAFQFVKGHIKPVVGDPGLRKIIGPDLLASLPCPHLQFPVLGDLFILLMLGFIQQPGTEYFQGFVLVTMLGFFVLAGYDHS